MKWLVIDSNNVAARCFAVLPTMEQEGKQTGAIFGYLQTFRRLLREFRPDATAHCFDFGEPARRRLYPDYKKNAKPTINGKDRKHLKLQLMELRCRTLEMLGCRNILFRDGFEADDIVAKVTSRPTAHESMIVSSDKDLYQCLTDTPLRKVEQYDPGTKKVLTAKTFQDKYRIHQAEWPKVKALMGDDSDNVKGVKGVKGVGEKTALKYLKGTLTGVLKAFIDSPAGRALTCRNLSLIKLPLEGVGEFYLQAEEDDITEGSWDFVSKTYGFKGLT